MRSPVLVLGIDALRSGRRWGRYLYPAGATNVRRWFFESLVAPGGRRERWARRLGASISLPVAEVMGGDPVRTVRRSLEPEEERESLRSLEAVLGRQEMTELLESRAGEWQVLVEFARPGVTGQRFLAFLFPDASVTPSLILRLEPAEAIVARQGIQIRIEALRRRLPGEMAHVLPRRVAWIEAEGSMAELYECLPGRTGYSDLLSTARPRKAFRVQLALCIDWLSRFHRATLVSDGVDKASIPRAAGHGDFWLRNILVSGERVSGVLDWESSSDSAPVTRDLHSFIVSLVEVYQRRRGVHDEEEAFRRYLVEEGWTKSAVNGALASYSERLDWHAPSLEVLLRSELEHRLAQERSPQRQASLRRRLCLLR